MALDTLICGFEMGSANEYTGATSLSTESTYAYLSPTYAKILGNGNVYWTLSDAGDWVVICSVHVRLIASSHIKPIKLTRGSYEWSVAFDDTNNEVRTVTLKYNATTYTFNYFIPADKWVNVVMYVGYKNFGLYIDSNMLYDDHDTYRAGSTGTVTDLRCEAFSGANNSTLYVDDVAMWYGSWGLETPVVLPLVPSSDQSVALSVTPANSVHYATVDELTANSDTDYVSYSGAGNAKDYYGITPVSNLSGKTLWRVPAVRMLANAKKDLAGTGAEKINFYVRVGDSGTEHYDVGYAVTTSYANYLRVLKFEIPTTSLLNTGDETALQIGIKITSTAGVDTRVTKLMGCALCLYVNNPYTGGMSQDIIGTGSWEVSFDVDTSTWADMNYIRTYVNVPCVPVGESTIDPNYNKMMVQVQWRNSLSQLVILAGAMNAGLSYIYTEAIAIGTRRQLKLRFIGHDNYLSVFESGVWLYTFSFTSVTYPSVVNLYLLSDITQSIYNVVAPELSDWREATYIDIQSSIASGISSVIQERPVEVIPQQGGRVDFSYNRTRTQITPSNINKHEILRANASSAGSHYIVYYRDVAMIVDEDFMDSDGYTSRVLQLSNLDSSAVEAARVISKRGREYQEQHTVELAPDIRIEPGDRVTISYTLGGTGTIISKDMIVESIALSNAEGDYAMQLKGRKYA